MGGAGSGSWTRWDTKDTVDSCRTLDVNRFKREGLLRSGAVFTLTWSRDGKTAATISGRSSGNLVDLRYTVTPRDGEPEEIREPVPITWTACTYGGTRPWFICPGVVNGRTCHRRVAKLYQGGRYFLCRHCYDLTYASRREHGYDRALTRAQDIRRRLGGSPNMALPFPARPKGMHWRTYERLHEEYREANAETWRQFLIYDAKASARVDRIIERSKRGMRRTRRTMRAQPNR